MKLEQAQLLAAALVDLLRPHCLRVEIAGSVRRQKAEVGDIELVAIPRTEPAVDLFSDAPAVRSRDFIAAALSIGELIRGDPTTGKYSKFLMGDENPTQVDLFMVIPENWGLQFAIRTGSADFSHQVLAKGWCRVGLESDEGMLRSATTGRVVHCREEQELFDLIGVPFVPPEKRL